MCQKTISFNCTGFLTKWTQNLHNKRGGIIYKSAESNKQCKIKVSKRNRLIFVTHDNSTSYYFLSINTDYTTAIAL